MKNEDVEGSVISVVAAVLRRVVQVDTSRENNEAWDSLKHIEIVFALEDQFGVQFDEECIATLDSVQRIVLEIKNRLNET